MSVGAVAEALQHRDACSGEELITDHQVRKNVAIEIARRDGLWCETVGEDPGVKATPRRLEEWRKTLAAGSEAAEKEKPEQQTSLNAEAPSI